jgi:hypothetical protein
MIQPSKLIMVDENGNECELCGTIELDELNTNDIYEIDPYKNISTTNLSMNINIDKSIPLTRKKFIKLLMSKGIQRNGANEIAKHVLKKHGKYTMVDLLLW